MIVDASALVAVLAGEPEARDLLDRLQSNGRRFTHPISAYESVLALARLKAISLEVARHDVQDFLTGAEVQVLPLDEAILDAALDAFARYGKRRGHPAKLNMGDCFSYAMAKVRGMPLLYKGDDFSRTDLA